MAKYFQILCGFLLGLAFVFALGALRYGVAENTSRIQATFGNKTAAAHAGWWGHFRWVCTDDAGVYEKTPACLNAIEHKPAGLSADHDRFFK